MSNLPLYFRITSVSLQPAKHAHIRRYVRADADVYFRTLKSATWSSANEIDFREGAILRAIPIQDSRISRPALKGK